MPTGALRRYAWRQWTGPSQDASPVDLLTKHCKQCLVSLGRIFRRVDEEVLKEVVFGQDLKKQRALRELAFAQQHQQNNTTHIPWPNRSDFPDHLPGDADILESAVKVKIPLPEGDLKELMAFLADTSSLRIWKAGAAYLLEHQGDSDSVPWHSAKQRALDLLELRQDALDIFKDIVDELRAGQFYSLCEGLAAKLRMLERFARIYNRQPMPSTMEHVPENEALYLYEPVPEWRKRKTYPAYPKRQEKYGPTLTIIVLVVTLVSFFPLIPAWKSSSNLPGSTADVDFWLLVQTSIMQLLGLFIAIYPLLRRTKTAAWLWARLFTALGCICAIGAIPMYLHLPTMWSALVCFVGAAAQAYMTLQFALVEGSVDDSL